jgi:Tfp pilus assembly protein PilF
MKQSYDKAISDFTEAIRLDPKYALAYYNRHLAYQSKGDYEKAIADFYEAARLDQQFGAADDYQALSHATRGGHDEAIGENTAAARPNPKLLAQAFCSRGVSLRTKGDDSAIEYFRRAVDLDSESAEAQNNLGAALAACGRLDEAVPHYRKALEIKRDYVDAHYNLALALSSSGRTEGAIAHYQKVLRIAPDHAMALNNLAWLRATCPEAALRDGAAAVELAQRANGLTGGKTPEMLDTLAAAYAEAGMFSKAKETAAEALALARRRNQAALAGKVQARLRLYEAGTPYRQSRRPSGH